MYLKEIGISTRNWVDLIKDTVYHSRNALLIANGCVDMPQAYESCGPFNI